MVRWSCFTHLDFLESLGKSHLLSQTLPKLGDIGRFMRSRWRWKVEGRAKTLGEFQKGEDFFCSTDPWEWYSWMMHLDDFAKKVRKYIIQSHRSYGGWKNEKRSRIRFQQSKILLVFFDFFWGDDFGLWVYREPIWNVFFAKCDLQRLGDQQKLHTLPRKSSKNDLKWKSLQ